tara:strand:- start:13356 stop:13934 length:579 start_codon:yes stop_codon:yes gene_type:complete
MSWFDIIKRLPAFARRDKHSEEQYYSPDKHYAKERYNPTDTKTAQPPTTYRSLVGGEYRDVERQPRVRMANSTEYRDVRKPGGRGERADYRPDRFPSHRERDFKNLEMIKHYNRVDTSIPRMKYAITNILLTPEYSLKIRRYQDGYDVSNVPFPTFEEVKNKMQLMGIELDDTTRFMREYDNLKNYWGEYFK